MIKDLSTKPPGLDCFTVNTCLSLEWKHGWLHLHCWTCPMIQTRSWRPVQGTEIKHRRSPHTCRLHLHHRGAANETQQEVSNRHSYLPCRYQHKARCSSSSSFCLTVLFIYSSNLPPASPLLRTLHPSPPPFPDSVLFSLNHRGLLSHNHNHLHMLCALIGWLSSNQPWPVGQSQAVLSALPATTLASERSSSQLLLQP